VVRIITTCVLILQLANVAFAAVDSPGDAIPLDTIWAHSIPGTLNVNDLDNKADLQLMEKEAASIPREKRDQWLQDELVRRSDVAKILNKLRTLPRRRDKVGPGFVVVGSGKTALKNAQQVFASRDAGKPADTRNVFPPNTELSLVWYTPSCGTGMQLNSVERSGKAISINYRLVAHNNAIMASHFALIPLGSLPEGEYQVRIEQVGIVDERNRSVKRLANCAVCRPFSFSVER
jgi:hypothetical protein